MYSVNVGCSYVEAILYPTTTTNKIGHLYFVSPFLFTLVCSPKPPSLSPPLSLLTAHPHPSLLSLTAKVYDEKKTDSDGGTGSIDSLIKSLETGDAGGLPMLRPGDASKYI
jgi:hypothetical protein